MKPLTKIFYTILFALLLYNSNTTSANNKITYQDFEMMLSDKWTTKIGCYTNGVAYDGRDESGDIHCRGKNILLPPKSHLKYFSKYFEQEKREDGTTHLVCGEKCINLLANRFSLVNFESAFNPYAVSSTADYGYIQVHRGKDFLGESKIQTSLDWLDTRWNDHKQNLCIDKYGISANNHSMIYKCLLMRHNGRTSLDNHYSNRGLVTRNYYISFLKNKFQEIKTGKVKNENILLALDKYEKKKELKKEEKLKKQKILQEKEHQEATKDILGILNILENQAVPLKNESLNETTRNQAKIDTEVAHYLDDNYVIEDIDEGKKLVIDKIDRKIAIKTIVEYKAFIKEIEKKITK